MDYLTVKEAGENGESLAHGYCGAGRIKGAVKRETMACPDLC